MEVEGKAESGKLEIGNGSAFVQRCFRFPISRFPLFLILAFIIYWPALHGQFVWDDELLVSKNPLVTGKATLANVWFETDFSLTSVALWLQWLLWGNNPLGYHAVNIALHAMNCFLLWRVLAQLKIPGAFAAALIFAVHPVCAASAAWISEMKNTLSLLFLLLSAWCFLKIELTEETAPRWERRRFYVLSIVGFAFALLSKTSTVMLPVALLLCWWWRRKQTDLRRTALLVAPFFLLALLLGCATIWFQSRVMATHDPVQTGTFLARFAAAGEALWFYVAKIFWPLDLSMIYPRWDLRDVTTLSYVPLFGWLALLFATWWLRNRAWARAAFFALSCFTVLLLPVLGFVSMDYLAISRVSDHFAYLPMIAVVVLAVSTLCKVCSSSFFPGIIAATTLVLSALTFQRAEVIATNENLWRDVLANNPGSFTARNNLGCILAAQNKLGDAITQFRAAIEINPKNAPAHCNLGRAYAIQRNFADAEKEFQTALELKSQDADIQQSYASALAEQGRLAEAIPHLRQAVKLEPKLELRLRLAAMLHQAGRPDEAVAEYRAVLERDSNSIEALNNIAWLLATSRDAGVRNGNEAVKFAERACSLTARKNPMMLGTLAAAYAEAGRPPDAIATATVAVKLAETAGDQRSAAMIRQLLSLFKAGQPVRE